MRVRLIHSAMLAAGILLGSPALAEDYPLPVLGATAYSEASYETEWEGGYETEGEVIYMDDLEDGEEWRSDGDYGQRVETVVRREYAPPPPRTGEPAWGGDHQLGYSEGERHAWLAECRARMGAGQDYRGGDPCGDYLARYEAGGGAGYDYSYGYGHQAGQGCGSCNCSGGCGCDGGCGCGVTYRFAPMPAAPVVQQRAAIRRIITTEEWDEEVPGKTVRVIPAPPPQPVPTKIVPAAPTPVKTTPVYVK